MLTLEQLRSIMPNLTEARGGELLPFLQAALAEFTIDPPPRAAAFLAQVAHESGQFRFMEELWGPTEAQRRYEPPSALATRLGNTEPGDGKRFKGRGPIQITGRANYRRYGALLGLDLLADPARAAGPDVGFRIAGLFWRENGLNELADIATDNTFQKITKRINGGLNGLAERQKFYERARQVLNVSALRTRGKAAPAERASATDGPILERGAEAIAAPARRRPQPRKAVARKGTGRRTTKRRTPSAGKVAKRKRKK